MKKALLIALLATFNIQNSFGMAYLYDFLARNGNNLIERLQETKAKPVFCGLFACAAAYYSIKRGSAWIKNFYNINKIINKENQTPLHLAVINGNVNLTQQLLQNGALTYIEDKQEHTPLFYVIVKENKNNNDYEIIKLLYQENDVRSLCCKHQKTNYIHSILKTALHLKQDLQLKDHDLLFILKQAIKNKCEDIVEDILKNHRDLLNTAQNNYKKPFSLAVEYDSLPVIQYFIDENNIKDDDLQIQRILRDPFLNAAKFDSTTIFKFLINYNWKHHILKSNSYVKDALHEAVNNNSINIIKELIPLIDDIDSRDKYHHSPIYNAIMKGHLEIADILYEKYEKKLYLFDEFLNDRKTTKFLLAKIDVGETLDEDNNNLLHIACNKKINAEVMENIHYQYIQHGYLIFQQNKNGNTPLHNAASTVFSNKKDKNLIEYILNPYDNPNTDPFNTTNNNKQTPLHIAILHQNFDVAKAIIKHVREIDINIKDTQGNTPLHLAINIKKPLINDTIEDVVTNILAKYQSIDDLVKPKNDQGETVFHYAAKQDTPFFIKSLIKRYIEIEKPQSAADKNQCLLNIQTIIKETNNNNQLPILQSVVQAEKYDDLENLLE